MQPAQELVSLEPKPHALATKPDFYELAPKRMTDEAGVIAELLSDIIKKQNLSVKIGGGHHVKVEGWTLAGAFLGIMAREKSVTHDGKDWIASVDLVVIKSGMVIGGASAMCGNSDELWRTRPMNAQRSMAITRATGKAFRLCLS